MLYKLEAERVFYTGTMGPHVNGCSIEKHVPICASPKVSDLVHGPQIARNPINPKS